MRSTILGVVVGSACFLSACHQGQPADHGVGPTSGGAGVRGDGAQFIPMGPGVPVKVTLPNEADEGSEVTLDLELDYTGVPDPGAILVSLQYEPAEDWINAPTQVYMNGPLTSNKAAATFRIRIKDRPTANSRPGKVTAIAFGPSVTMDARPMKIRGRP